ncbi:Zinc finger RING/FYVE/PHD-type protein [Dioscorea alata]|uniref:Zinc finger RING/FYVE/PHD-type protein n=1 Tax=Dioscorea alata TaxID=55571 RepID=A0ACB7W6E4_DIOAL|nr:Zinc finger RING/FYVE/PHD-type protein [Dioscorea alata]
MAKSGERPPPENAAKQLKSELRRLVLAITDNDDVPCEIFNEAFKTLVALREMKANGGNDKPQQHRQVPEHFLCPISSEIMRDPVVVSSGQTYDRQYIQEWLNSGNLTCPQTQKVLSNTTLLPNNLVCAMIGEWCCEHGTIMPRLEFHEEGLITRSDRYVFTKLVEKISYSSVTEQRDAVRELRLLTKRNRSFRALICEYPDAIARLLSVLSVPELSEDNEVQEDIVTAILNLSINDSNKKIVGKNPLVIPFLIEALETGTMETRSNSAAALFTLSAVDSNKSMIGELGAMQPLLDLLEHGSMTAKKDAASAIFSLCTTLENRAIAVREGAVALVLKNIMDQCLVDESLAILAMLSSNREGAEELRMSVGVPCLLKVIKANSCPRNEENAVVALFFICMNDRTKLWEVGEEENSSGAISQLAQNGTSRARRKAYGILERLRRAMFITH